MDGVAGSAQHPVEELFHGHMTEATAQVVAFVAGMTGRGKRMVHAHVVGERQAAGDRRPIRKTNPVDVTVTCRKPIQRTLHRPREPPQLEEQMIHGQIERVHHAVLAFVHDPDRRFVP